MTAIVQTNVDESSRNRNSSISKLYTFFQKQSTMTKLFTILAGLALVGSAASFSMTMSSSSSPQTDRRSFVRTAGAVAAAGALTNPAKAGAELADPTAEVDYSDFTTSESGLKYKVLKEGTGAIPQAGQTVKVSESRYILFAIPKTNPSIANTGRRRWCIPGSNLTSHFFFWWIEFYYYCNRPTTPDGSTDLTRSRNSILLVTAEDPLPFPSARDRWSEDGTRPLHKCRLENADRLFFHRDWPMETVELAESSLVVPPCISMLNCWESCKRNARSFGILALVLLVLSFLPRRKNIRNIP